MTAANTALTTVDTMTDTVFGNNTDSRLSVSDVAKRLEMNRGTLYNRIKASDSYEGFKAAGITGDNNSILYLESAWVELLESVDLSLPSVLDEIVEKPSTPVLAVYDGNHQETLANIELDNSFTLGELRSPLTTVQSYADPLAMAQQVVAQNQQMIAAMSNASQQRQQQLDQANQALATVEASNYQLLQQVQQYQIDSTVQGALLNQATVQLQQKIAIQQQLGKSPAGATSQP